MAAYRGPQQRPVATAPGAAKPPRRPRAFKDRTRPRETGAQRRSRDRDEIGPLGAFLRLERGGTDLLIVPTERREENAARGPESARSHTRWGVCRSVGGSPPARRRRVHRRCLASRHDVVPNLMSACLASSRGIASPGHKHGGGRGNGQSRGRRPRTAGGQGDGDGPDRDWRAILRF